MTREVLSTFMTEDGEPFNQDELDEMLEIALDPHTQSVPYEYYINQLMVRSLCTFFSIINSRTADIYGTREYTHAEDGFLCKIKC